MTLFNKAFAAIALSGAALLAAPASAAIITRTFSIAASDFYPDGGPFPVITGNFSVTFDNAADIGPTTNGLTITDFTLAAYGSNYAYSAYDDALTFGTVVDSDVYILHSNTNEYGFFLEHASTNPVLARFKYETVGDAVGFYARNFGVAAAAVPEPATWAMMLFAFGLAGLGLRASRRPMRVSYG